jgi:hypothetical protein
MVQEVTDIIMCYEERVRSLPFVPRLSHVRKMLSSDGDPIRLFLTYLFNDHSMAIEFNSSVLW